MTRNRIVEIISGVFIFLFVYTAISKLLDYNNFKTVLNESPLIGNKAGLVALGLPFAEGLVSALLFVPRTRLWGLYGSAALMTMFTLYMAYIITFSPHLPCSCGGVLQQMTWNQHLIFNLVFLALSIIGIIVKRKQMQKETEAQPPPVVFT